MWRKLFDGWLIPYDQSIEGFAGNAKIPAKY
jgi:hypothetical protein